MPFSEDNTLRVLAEDTLLNSDELSRLILDSASEAICGCDSEGICLFSNPSAARILGYDDPAELLGKNMHALEHHTRKDGTPYPIEECPIYMGFQKNENVHRDDEVYWRKDGTSFPVEYWSHLVIREGKTLGAVITFIDITERKQAEAALRKSEEQNRSLLQINNAIITNLTQQALLLSISEALHPGHLIRPMRDYPLPARERYFPLPRRGGRAALGLLSDRDRRTAATKPASVGCSTISDLSCAAILRKSSSIANERRLAAEGIQSMCVLPLALQGKCIGLLSLVSRRKGSVFG